MWEDALGDWFYADRFGWPPTVVAQQPAGRMLRLKQVQLLVEEMRREAENDASR